MGKKDRCNVNVVLNQISFGDSPFWPEKFVEVCELHYTTIHLDFQILFLPWEFYPRYVRRSLTSGVFASTDYGRMIFAGRNLDHFRLKISDLRFAVLPLLLL